LPQLDRFGLCITTLRTVASAVQGVATPNHTNHDEASKAYATSKVPLLASRTAPVAVKPLLYRQRRVRIRRQTREHTNRVVVPSRGSRDKSSLLEHNFDADDRVNSPRFREMKGQAWAGDCSEPASELCCVSVWLHQLATRSKPAPARTALSARLKIAVTGI